MAAERDPVDPMSILGHGPWTIDDASGRAVHGPAGLSAPLRVGSLCWTDSPTGFDGEFLYEDHAHPLMASIVLFSLNEERPDVETALGHALGVIAESYEAVTARTLPRPTPFLGGVVDGLCNHLLWTSGDKDVFTLIVALPWEAWAIFILASVERAPDAEDGLAEERVRLPLRRVDELAGALAELPGGGNAMAGTER